MYKNTVRQYNKNPNKITYSISMGFGNHEKASSNNIMKRLRKMSDHIPFEIQTEIMKRLPARSLSRFRWVSKQWKSLIENSEFINDHIRIHRNRPQHHLLVRSMFECTSIIDDDTFPNQKSSLTLPPPLSSLCDYPKKMLGSVNGLLCFYGFHTELEESIAVLWNPIINKSVGIVIPPRPHEDIVIGFGFCSDTSSDPKLVGVNKYYKKSKAMVFTLSSGVWKSVSNVPPALGLGRLHWNQVCIKGCIYFCAVDYTSDCSVIVSFDLKSDKFGQVRLPECLLKKNYWKVAEVNESLGVFTDDSDNEVKVCGVWMMDFVTKSFTKMFTIKQPTGKWPYHGQFDLGVLGFRKNGEVIIQVKEDERYKYRLEFYEPSSGRINGIGINGKTYTQSVSLYLETLLLLDVTSSIIPL